MQVNYIYFLFSWYYVDIMLLIWSKNWNCVVSVLLKTSVPKISIVMSRLCQDIKLTENCKRGLCCSFVKVDSYNDCSVSEGYSLTCSGGNDWSAEIGYDLPILCISGY